LQAIDRLKKAVEGKPRGWRGPNREQHLVEVFAGDVVECCAKVAQSTQVTADLKKGSAGLRPEQLVAIQADDCYHLIDQAGPASAEG